MVTSLTQDTFAAFIAKPGSVVVDFYADWCGPCKAIAPIIDELATENPNVAFGKLNVDDNPDLSMQYNVSSIPTILIFKDGKVVNQVVGGLGKEGLKKAILG